MSRRPVRAAVVGLAIGSLTACSGAPAPDGDASSTPTVAAAPTAASLPMPEVGEMPIEHDAGYADGVATFGTDQVVAAVTADARIAHIALADCVRWRTGAVDPRLGALLTPGLLTRVVEELDRPDGTVTSLLSHLPSDDGNGNDEAAAVVDGCAAGAPVRSGPAPLTVAVDRADAEPRLVLSGSFVVDLAFGDLRVQAGQDWRFTSEHTDGGWRLADVTAGAHVNWAPPREG